MWTCYDSTLAMEMCLSRDLISVDFISKVPGLIRVGRWRCEKSDVFSRVIAPLWECDRRREGSLIRTKKKEASFILVGNCYHGALHCSRFCRVNERCVGLPCSFALDSFRGWPHCVRTDPEGPLPVRFSIRLLEHLTYQQRNQWTKDGMLSSNL